MPNLSPEIIGSDNENMPLASSIAGIDTTYLLALAAVAGAGVSFRKLTPYFHETIGPNEVGVLLHRGNPVERKIVSDERLDTKLGQRKFHRGKITTEEKLAEGGSRYVIAGSGFYLVPLKKNLERVYVADQVSKLGFDLMSQERHLTHVEADVTWNICPEGDAPLHSITRIKHVKQDKKDIEKKEDGENHLLASQVLSICAAGLGRVLTGKSMHELQYINKKPVEVTDYTIEECGDEVDYYGGRIKAVRLMPITWKDNETIAQAIRSLNRVPLQIANATAEVTDTETGVADVIDLKPEPIPA
jgi:hypothetical protein